MQNLDVKETNQKIKKTKPVIKKELEKSIINRKKNENTDMQEKVENCATMKKTEKKLFKNLKRLLKKIESDFIWLVYHPGQIYQKFKEKERFVIMVSKFGVSQQ